jgi:hypothetical protein
MLAEPESYMRHFAGDGYASSRYIIMEALLGSAVILHNNETKYCDHFCLVF